MTEFVVLCEEERQASGFKPLHPTVCEGGERLKEVFLRRRKATVWIVPRRSRLGGLVQVASESPERTPAGRLLIEGETDAGTVSALTGKFHRVLAGAQVLLNEEELSVILGSEHPEDYCIAARWLPGEQAVLMWRGDFRTIYMTLEDFRGGSPMAPDPNRLSLEDFGQSVRMGDFEASMDAILYETDARYRRRVLKNQIDADMSFGGALRRLRLQRRLARTDFPGIAEKTVARIERGEIGRPRGRTLQILASTLRVTTRELGTF